MHNLRRNDVCAEKPFTRHHVDSRIFADHYASENFVIGKLFLFNEMRR
jgi:hypothetical protein